MRNYISRSPEPHAEIIEDMLRTGTLIIKKASGKRSIISYIAPLVH